MTLSHSLTEWSDLPNAALLAFCVRYLSYSELAGRQHPPYLPREEGQGVPTTHARAETDLIFILRFKKSLGAFSLDLGHGAHNGR